MIALLWIIIAYLLGSISFAIVLSRLFRMQDPREYGSHNPGATNMLRSGRKSIALLTLIGDALKGFLPVFFAQKLTDLPVAPLATIALAAFIGHLYPIFFNFKGGKGVATFLGAILALSFYAGVCALLTWVLIAMITRYSSLSSLLSSLTALLVFIIEWGWGQWIFSIIAMLALLFWRHHTNISRLCTGTESKLFSTR